MQHRHLVDVYNKARKHYNKKNFRRAKKLFEKIVSELYASDTDCMADIELCNSSEDYLEEINELNLNNNILGWIILGAVLIIILIYFIYQIN
jgi:hypothetical protein